MLQSLTITENDQEVCLKTYVPTTTFDDRKDNYETVYRQSISQRMVSVFPMFVYNIGQRKIIVQNTLTNGRSYVYEIPHGHKFLTFGEYNNFEDIGFYPGSMRLEMCSNFVFLTQERSTQLITLNLFLIDPYYEVPQMALIQSKRKFKFPYRTGKYDDVMIKTILYMSQKQADIEVKCLTQYPNFYNIMAIRDPTIDDEEDSQGEDIDDQE